MSRLLPLALLFLTSIAVAQPPAHPPAPKAQQDPPEEDESIAPKEYSFNPLQATKEVTIGNYYFKKHNYRAAAKRFTEATHWNPGFAEAYLRLAEAKEKLDDKDSARISYAKYIELAPDAKNADAVRKKLARKSK